MLTLYQYCYCFITCLSLIQQGIPSAFAVDLEVYTKCSEKKAWQFSVWFKCRLKTLRLLLQYGDKTSHY